jgi:small subunit ribosomal protein S20
MAKEQAKAKKAKVKAPTALKRDLQSEKNRLRNKAFRSRVSSAIKLCIDKTCAQDKLPENLSAVYSLMDKGVKKGVFKKNKANRLKSRLTKRVSAAKA